jgi:hypothetical protein
MSLQFERPPRPEFGSAGRSPSGRAPIVRVRGAHNTWLAEDDACPATGSGRTPEEAVGDWFVRNADRLGFEVRRYRKTTATGG